MTAPGAPNPGDYWQDVCPPDERELAPDHLRLLEEESAIAPDIVKERGYHSPQLSQIYELVNLGVLADVAIRAKSWLAIPTFRPDGTKYGEVIRLFGDGLGQVKYLWPSSHHLTFDVHPSTFHWMDTPTVDILITEGIKKADALLSAARREGYRCVVISISGNYGWRTKTSFGGTTAVADFYDIDWKDRRVYIICDSDFRSNNQVAYGWSDCASYVEGKTGEHKTFLVVVPQGESRAKQGADDYLASGKTLESLLALYETRQYALASPRDSGEPLPTVNLLSLVESAGEFIPYLTAPLIPEASITLMAGHTGTFKTWAALQLCLDGALGLCWWGHPKLKRGEPFTSLYVNKEMSGSILGLRAKLFMQDERYLSIPDYKARLAERLHFVHKADLDLNVPAGLASLEEAIVRHGAKLVVLDSLSMSWHGDENSASEVGAFYTALRAVSERTGVAWLIIHHLLKPSSSHLKKTDPVTASIRGSGQLTQQADVALLLAHYPSTTEDERLISVVHAKARTDVELAAWVVRFSAHDGLYATMAHLCSLSDAKAQTSSTYPQEDRLRIDWVLEACRTMSKLQPMAVGLDQQTIAVLLQQAWTVPDKKPPTTATLQRDIQKLVAAGRLEKIGTEANRDIYRLTDPEEDDEDEPPPASKDEDEEEPA